MPTEKPSKTTLPKPPAPPVAIPRPLDPIQQRKILNRIEGERLRG